MPASRASAGSGRLVAFLCLMLLLCGCVGNGASRERTRSAPPPYPTGLSAASTPRQVAEVTRADLYCGALLDAQLPSNVSLADFQERLVPCADFVGALENRLPGAIRLGTTERTRARTWGQWWGDIGTSV